MGYLATETKELRMMHGVGGSVVVGVVRSGGGGCFIYRQ